MPNQLLCILAGSTDARDFRQWEDVGRNVKKGARCVRILTPRTRQVTEMDREAGTGGPAKAAMRVLGDAQTVLAILLDEDGDPR